MNIGEVAERSGIPPKTIRYYEDIGLVRLGFSIEDCRNLLSLYEDETRESAQVKTIAEEHLRAIDDKIAQLQEMHETLSHLVEACHGDHRPDCPILKDLSGELKNLP